VLLVTLVLGWLWMLPAAYAQLSADCLPARRFLQYRAVAAVSYFDIDPARSRCCICGRWASRTILSFWPLILIVVARLRLSILVAAFRDRHCLFGLNVALIAPIRWRTLSALHPAWELLARGCIGLQLEPGQPNPCGEQFCAPAWASR